MKNQENIDELLKNAFSEEDAEVLKRIEEQGLFDLMASNFHGKLKWFAVLSSIIMIVLFVLSVYCFVQFYNATDLREMILWGTGMGMGMMLWIWLG